MARTFVALPLLCAAFLLVSAGPVQSAEEWQTAVNPPNIDTSGLSAAQKQELLKVLRSESCTCGCGMKVAECRMKDPRCSVSRSLTAMSTRAVKEGKTEAEVRAELAHFAATGPGPLDPPVAVDIAGEPYRGPANARLTIVEFSDFQCPYCAKAVAKVNEVLAKYPQDVKFVFKQFPLDGHPQARLAAAASLAAKEQGKFWPMHDKMYANYNRLSRQNILAWAQELGMNMPRFTADLDSGKFTSIIDRDLSQGEEAGVQGTPTFFLNGQKLNQELSPEIAQQALSGAKK